MCVITTKAANDPMTNIEQRKRSAVYMIQVMNILFDENHHIEDIPVLRCGLCKIGSLSLEIASAFITTKALKDLQEEKGTFVHMEPHLKECVDLLSSKGDIEKIVAFVLYVGNDLKYPCPSCKGTSWEKIPA